MINVIVPCFNKLEFTRKCLWSLYRYCPEDKFNLMVVNDGSSDGTMDFLNEFCLDHKNMGFINSIKNNGFVKSINMGIKYYLNTSTIVDNDLIHLLNNDIEIKGSWYDNVTELFELRPKLMLAGPSGHKKMLTAEVTFISNSRSFFRVFILKKLGLLDEEIFYGYYDDVDYSLRVIQAGYSIKKYVIPSEHPNGTSFRQIKNTSKIRQKNKEYVERKHRKYLLENL